MKSHDTAIQELRNCFMDQMQDEPSKALKNRVLENAANGTAARYTIKRRIGLKPALIAASIAMILLITGFTFGADIIATIQQFVSGDLSVAQVESLHNGNVTMTFEITNQSKPEGYSTRERWSYSYSTVEEARETALFGIKEPAFIPENASLESVYEQGTEVWIKYIVKTANGADELMFVQYYLGPDASVDIKTVFPLQSVIINDVEAFVMIAEEDTLINIYWIKDEVLFQLYSASHDLDTLIRIIEAIE